MLDFSNTLLIYLAFFNEWVSDFFKAVALVAHAMMVAHAIFIIIVEIAFAIMKIREHFDKKK